MKFRIVAALTLVAIAVMATTGCSSKPYVMYAEGSIDEADVVTFNISVDRTTIFIDGKKIAIRHSEVRMAPGTYKVRVEANTSFDRNPDAAKFDKLVTDLKRRGVPWASSTERPNTPIEAELTFEPQPGKSYTLHADLIMRPQPQSKPREQMPPAEWVIWIEEF